MPPGEHRQAINRINKHHIYRPLILTSREEAFAAAIGHARVKNCEIVKLEPLAQPDVTAYLKHTASGGWTRVLASLPDNAALRRVLENPLMLYLARREYEHADPQELAYLAYFDGQAVIRNTCWAVSCPPCTPSRLTRRAGSAAGSPAGRAAGSVAPASRPSAGLGICPPRSMTTASIRIRPDPMTRHCPNWPGGSQRRSRPVASSGHHCARRPAVDCAAGAVAVWVLTQTGNWRHGAYTGPVNFTSLLLSGPVGRLIRPTAHILGIAATRAFGHSRLTTWGRVIDYYFAHSALVVLTAAVLLAVATVFTVSGGSAGPAFFPRRLKFSAAKIAARTLRGCRTFFFLALVPSVVLLWLAHWPGSFAAFWHARSTWIALASVTLLGLRTAATALDVPSETVGDPQPEGIAHARPGGRRSAEDRVGGDRVGAGVAALRAAADPGLRGVLGSDDPDRPRPWRPTVTPPVPTQTPATGSAATDRAPWR